MDKDNVVYTYNRILVSIKKKEIPPHQSKNRTNGEQKRLLLLGRKAMTNLDSILKSRDITLLTKVSIIKAMVFQ